MQFQNWQSLQKIAVQETPFPIIPLFIHEMVLIDPLFIYVFWQIESKRNILLFAFYF